MIHVDFTNKDDVDQVIKGMDKIIQESAATSIAKDIVYKPNYHVIDNAVMNSLIFISVWNGMKKISTRI